MSGSGVFWDSMAFQRGGSMAKRVVSGGSDLGARDKSAASQGGLSGWLSGISAYGLLSKRPYRLREYPYLSIANLSATLA